MEKIIKKLRQNKNKDGTIEKEIFDIVSNNFSFKNKKDIEYVVALTYLGSINVVFLNSKEIIKIVEEQEKVFNGEKDTFYRRLGKTFRALYSINNKTLQELYSIIMGCENALTNFILNNLNNNDKLISDLSVLCSKKIEKIIKSKNLDEEKKYFFNAKILNEIYFAEKIIILKKLYKKNLFKLTDLDMFSKEKVNQLLKIKYKDKSDKNEKVFMELVDIFIRIKNIRNSLSHNDLIMLNKSYASELAKNLEIFEDFVRLKTFEKSKQNIKEIIENELKNFKYKRSLINLFSKFLK